MIRWKDLDAARKALGDRLVDAWEALGIHEQTWYRWKRHGTGPRHRSIQITAQVYVDRAEASRGHGR